ncbi:Arc family DNA-binding protein [Pseudomonas nicosulfuronedens]|uniref:Arc family DNA-binding protein n=1 Tax=Pseudomonas nicosulfuronedens TaxID=2571105 RepID=UPI0024471E49|nr:Arc family DNA-binding protein [Pseudomonas nicosulfuronedens]MDH1007567.1 Arc family DNA-binding protein [Pseudomonas nicosulfuronedens]MDH1977612.1 Arc family DNA-binding protein [Pseudomonas nicosulfuronedens]MDH2025788.1 Arc family DNA-binding protein [Pseudomonas nicosulfuronedens]
MSREDPQFKLRMPVELRSQVESAAKASGRSLNSELVARLESTFVAEPSENLISASRARELALLARAGIPDEIRKRARFAISRAVQLGHSSAYADLSDLRLEVGISDAELDLLINPIKKELINAGYIIDWDDISSISISF